MVIYFYYAHLNYIKTDNNMFYYQAATTSKIKLIILKAFNVICKLMIAAIPKFSTINAYNFYMIF